jgi:predicted Zn-dependent protease
MASGPVGGSRGSEARPVVRTREARPEDRQELSIHRQLLNALALIAAVLALGSCAAAKKLARGESLSASDVSAADVKKAVDVVKKIQSLTEEIRPDQEYYVGRAVATNILARHEYRYVDKASIARGELDGMTRYVNDVGQLVAAAALESRRDGDRPAPVAGFHFVVVESDKINAFAAPGGYVFITTAAVKTARSEDELAALLAHEVAHVVRGHALGNIQKSRYAGVSAELLQAAGTATLTPEQLNQLNQLLEGIINDTLEAMFVKGYSRDTEFEADEVGVAIAARAGYDPKAMSRFLDSLAKQQATSEGGFYATHPSTKERQEKLGARTGAMPAVTVPKARVTRFEAALAKLK